MQAKRMWGRSLHGRLAAAVVLVCVGTGGVAAQRSVSKAYPFLRGIPDEKVKQKPVIERTTLRRRFVHADPNALYEPGSRVARPQKPRKAISLELFDGQEIAAVLLRLDVRRDGNFTWFGTIPNEEIGDVILTVVDGVMMGRIHKGAETYHLRALEREVFELLELDLEAFEAHDEPFDGEFPRKDLNDLVVAEHEPPKLFARRFEAGVRNDYLTKKRPYSVGRVGPNELKVITDTGARIDLAVAYTSDAVSAASVLVGFDGNPIPTATDIHTAIQHSVDTANTTLVSSGIPTWLNVVQTYELADDQPNVDAEAMLDHMEQGDGLFEEILDRADQYRADITSMFVAKPSAFGETCGRARVLPEIVEPVDQDFHNGRGKHSIEGKNVVDVGCAVRNNTLVHEIGHNAGLRHDLYVEPKDPALPWGHGFVAVPVRRRTVMAYDNLCRDFFPEEIPVEPPIAVCKRLPRFSNPYASFDGWPLGALETPFTKPVNASGAMIQALWTVANFRLSQSPPP